MKFSEAFYFLYFQLMMGLSGHNPIIGQERSVIPGHLDSLSWNINNMRRRIILSHTRLFRFQLKCSLTEEWIKKMWCIYTMEYYSATKKKERMLFSATCMNLEIFILRAQKCHRGQSELFNPRVALNPGPPWTCWRWGQSLGRRSKWATFQTGGLD